MNKKNIIIIGDSWGIVPTTIYRHANLDQKKHHISNTSIYNWLDYKLMSLGHSVNNRSWGGSNPFYQLTLAETQLDAAKHHNFNVDLVIWFHAELSKEIYWGADNLDNPKGYLKTIKNNGLEFGLDEIANELYQYVYDMHIDNPNTKWAIIGAGAATRKSKHHLLDFADLFIENLISDITGLELPECHTYYCIHDNNVIDVLLEKNIFTKEEADNEIEKWNKIYKATENPELFFNHKHPSPLAYSNLVEKIINKFEL